MRTVVQEIASLIDARLTCLERAERDTGNSSRDWALTHRLTLGALIKERLPSGAGLDNGVQLDLARSTPEKIVLVTAFHHMNETGMYDGWTDHTITVRASLLHGVKLTISGLNRDEIKDHLHEIFNEALLAPFEPDTRPAFTRERVAEESEA